MRLSDADREQLFSQLSRHAAAGRLDLPELERRVEAVAAAQTTEEAAAVMSDLPPLAAPAEGASGAGASRGQARSGRPRRHGQADRPDAGWRPTPERFRDPRTGQVMRVWEDSSGGRHYVPDGDRPPSGRRGEG